jgi:hypothetical protein
VVEDRVGLVEHRLERGDGGTDGGRGSGARFGDLGGLFVRVRGVLGV